MLEESLAEFPGALVLVTHDRFMLERVVDRRSWPSTGGAEPRRSPTTRSGRPRAQAAAPAGSTRHAARARSPGAASARGRSVCGYTEQREWDGMEAAILEAESALEACRRAAEDPAIASDPAALQERYAALEAARAEVDRLYARWAELEAKQA